MALRVGLMLLCFELVSSFIFDKNEFVSRNVCMCALSVKMSQYLLPVLLVRRPLPDRDAGQEEDDKGRKDRRQDSDPFDALDDVQRNYEDAPPDNDLAEVVRMA